MCLCLELKRASRFLDWESNFWVQGGEAGFGCGCCGSWEPWCRAARSGATQALGGWATRTLALVSDRR